MLIKKRTIYIETPNGRMKTLVFDSRESDKKVPGLLWFHGGGYIFGFPGMIRLTAAYDLLKKYEMVIIAPAYTLATKSPYPAALNDCYASLKYLNDNAEELGIDNSKIMIGGESAGGGLCIATTIYAQSQGNITVRYMFPLYPMIDCYDTETSKNNHGHLWNTRRNHIAWQKYLGELRNSDKIPSYASPSRLHHYSTLPPFYTFVCDGEPFYAEAYEFVNKAQRAGVDARIKEYHSKTHAFDMALPFLKVSKQARKDFLENYEKNVRNIIK